MDKLILENVRCFRGHHELPLAPLTILVGENSTGKSTVLAAARHAVEICRGGNDLNYNRDPFDWGAYDEIAYVRGGRGQAKEFTIGCEFALDLDDVPKKREKAIVTQVTATFERKELATNGFKMASCFERRFHCC